MSIDIDTLERWAAVERSGDCCAPTMICDAILELVAEVREKRGLGDPEDAMLLISSLWRNYVNTTDDLTEDAEELAEKLRKWAFETFVLEGRP